jgi:hypothetical protein
MTTTTHAVTKDRWSQDKTKFAGPSYHGDEATPSGLYIWDPSRRVVLGYTSQVTRKSETATFEHATLLAMLSDHIDTLDARGDSVLLAEATYDLILSDLETGTSLATWPALSRLVDHTLGQALNLAHLVTVWPEF